MYVCFACQRLITCTQTNDPINRITIMCVYMRASIILWRKVRDVQTRWRVGLEQGGTIAYRPSNGANASGHPIG